jgi:molecular chaperone DnaK (HSP70)
MQEFSGSDGCTDDISEILETMQSLRQLAEKAKIQLSEKKSQQLRSSIWDEITC